ncbi:hypothetical protein ACLOJK_020474 [Asimina triloba]
MPIGVISCLTEDSVVERLEPAGGGPIIEVMKEQIDLLSHESWWQEELDSLRASMACQSGEVEKLPRALFAACLLGQLVAELSCLPEQEGKLKREVEASRAMEAHQ